MGFTGPFEVLSLIPNARFHIFWKDLTPVRDGSIQLTCSMRPEPPFAGGTRRTSAPEIVEAARSKVRDISERRLATTPRVAESWELLLRARPANVSLRGSAA